MGRRQREAVREGGLRRPRAEQLVGVAASEPETVDGVSRGQRQLVGAVRAGAVGAVAILDDVLAERRAAIEDVTAEPQAALAGVRCRRRLSTWPICMAGSNTEFFWRWHGSGTGHGRHSTHETSLQVSMCMVWVIAGVPSPTVTTYIY